MDYLTVPELLRRGVERFGDAPALVTRSGASTFSELGSHVAGVSSTLKNKGLRSGDRVLLVAPNTAATDHVWLGAIAAGLLPAAVNPELTVPELRYLAEDLDAALVVAEGAQAERLRSSLGRPSLELSGLGRERASAPEPAAASPLDPAAIVYTSGTTSRPAELFVVEAGQATFQLGEKRIVVESGHIVIGPADIAHGFTNTGTGELRLTAIHCAPAFKTDWVAAPILAGCRDRGPRRQRSERKENGHDDREGEEPHDLRGEADPVVARPRDAERRL